MQVYLAGPMPGPSVRGVDWRTYAASRLERHGITTVSPRFLGEYVDEFNIYEEHAAVVLTRRDHRFSTESDVVLFNFDSAAKRSMGSCIELGWATQAGAIVVSVLPVGCEHDHPMITSCTDFRCHYLDEALAVVASLA